MDTGSKVENYDDLRPYYDSEIPAAMQRMAESPMLGEVAGYAFPGADVSNIRATLRKMRTADEFQSVFVRYLLENIVKATTSDFTVGGMDNLDRTRGHLYISNHRDIVLDTALLQYMLLVYANMSTTEITFGSNLISPGFVEDFGRSNKMFKIVRGGSARDLVHNSRILSEHLHYVVDDGRSIWISQRDGRTKDGNDRTDQGLIKMFVMHGDEDTRTSLKALNIAPVAISYQYESCDALKARELYLTRRGPYAKAPGEDMNSIITGVKQYKGEVHMEVCRPIEPFEIDALEGESNNDVLRGMASLIDSRVIAGYKLYDTNFIAYDILKGTPAFAEKYTPGARSGFEKYISDKVAGLGIEEGRDELTDIMLDIYANPVKNKLEAGVELQTVDPGIREHAHTVL